MVRMEAATSIPTKMLYNGSIPALTSSPKVPFGSQLRKNILVPKSNPDAARNVTIRMARFSYNVDPDSSLVNRMKSLPKAG
jgi:hypothetical protein